MLKGFGSGILGFLLFIFLIVFGVAFTVNSTALNPNFFSSQLDEIDVSSLVQDMFNEEMDEGDFPEELMTAIVDAVDKLEAPVKVQFRAFIDDVYDYLLGKRDEPDLASALSNTFLNSAFVDSVLAELDMAALAEEVLSEQAGEHEFSAEFKTALVDTITEYEPEIKEKISATSDPIFDYILGETPSIDLAYIIRHDILTSDFVITLLEGLDISSLALEFLGGELALDVPEDLEFLTDEIDDAIADFEATVKEELGNSADQILDYMLGERASISVTISLTPIIDDLEDSLREAFMEQLPPEYAGLSQSELDQIFDDGFAEFSAGLPSTFELDETMLPDEVSTQFTAALADAEDALENMRDDIAQAIADAEEVLEEAREYVSWFQLGYKILIGVIVLLILGIVLIYREVKGATLTLGIIFLTYGVIHFAGIMIARYFGERQWPPVELPVQVDPLLWRAANDVIAPLQWFSLGLLIVGAVLIVVSIIYPRLRPSYEGDTDFVHEDNDQA